MWLARVMTAVQRVCYALEAAVRSPLLFRFRAGFHCQIVDVVGRSHSRRNQGAAAVLAPEKTPVFSSPAVSSLRASSPLKKLQFALNATGRRVVLKARRELRKSRWNCSMVTVRKTQPTKGS